MLLLFLQYQSILQTVSTRKVFEATYNSYVKKPPNGDFLLHLSSCCLFQNEFPSSFNFKLIDAILIKFT